MQTSERPDRKPYDVRKGDGSVRQEIRDDAARKLLRQGVKDGKTPRQLAEMIGITTSALSYRMKRLGVTNPNAKQGNTGGRPWYRAAMERKRKGMQTKMIVEELHALGFVEVKAATLQSYFNRVSSGLTPDPFEGDA